MGNRSWVLTARAFMMAFSAEPGMEIPSSEGDLIRSPWMRSMESGGSCPVMQRYSVAPMAYTSVQGP